MKKLMVLLVVVFMGQSARVQAEDRPCFERYREASEWLIDAARDFNNGYYDEKEFLGQFWFIESRLAAARLACAFESDYSKSCSLLYKKQYKKLRDEVNTRAILDGSQTKVKVGLVEAGLIAVDLKCKR